MTAVCAAAMKFSYEVGSCAATPFALPLSVFHAVMFNKGGTSVNLTTISMFGSSIETLNFVKLSRPC